MSIAKQIFYHNLRNGNKTEVEIYNRDIKPFVEKESALKLLGISSLLKLLRRIERIKNKE